MKYVFRLSGRLQINVSSLNASGAVGNYTALQRAHIVIQRNKGSFDIVEIPGVITGNMLKHWHAKVMALKYQEMGGKRICTWCSRGVMYRTEDLGGVKVDSEEEAVRRCAIHDAHGFLAAKEPPIRRESIIKTSFLLPVEEIVSELTADPITFNRVVVTEKGEISGDMMVFKREHLSTIYGFAFSADIYALARKWASAFRGEGPFDVDEYNLRLRTLLEAVASVLYGEFGSSRARSAPIIKPLQIIAVASKRLIPALTHGFYKDWIDVIVNMLASLNVGKEELEVYVYGIEDDKLAKLRDKVKVEQVHSIYDISKKAYEFLRLQRC